MGILTSNLNNLAFTGDFDRPDLRRLLAALHNVRSIGFASANLDFTRRSRAFTPAILPLAVNCRYLLHAGFEVRLELPEDGKLQRLSENSNWAYLIDPLSYPKSNFDSMAHLPAILYTNRSCNISTSRIGINKGFGLGAVGRRYI
jgi:hypothetical protein